MADRTYTDDGKLEVITLSREEAANVAALLTAQLADVPLQGNEIGAAPVVKLVESGRILCEVAFFVKSA